MKVTVAFSKTLPRKKHINGSRGGYPIGGRPFVRGRGETWGLELMHEKKAELLLTICEPNINANIFMNRVLKLTLHASAGWPSHRGSFGVGFSRGGRIGYGGGRRPAYDEPRFIRGPRKYIADEKPFHEDRPRIRAPPRGRFSK